jgi:hypothetical protein
MAQLLPLARLRGDVPVIGPTAVGVANLTTVSSQVLAADPVRHGVLFHNPSATIAKRVAPANMALAGGAGGIIIYPQSDWLLLDQGEDERFNVNSAWKAVTDDNSDATLTIWNFTDQPQAGNPPLPLADLNLDYQIASPFGTQISGLSNVSQAVLGQNTRRRGILFHNPDTVIIWVSPANLAAVAGAGSRQVLPGQELRIKAQGRVRVNCGFNAIAASAGAHSLTVLEFL